MKILFEVDAALCSACGACAIACMDQNDVDTSLGQQPFRKVYQYETPARELVSFSMACMHCADAPCVTGCPAGVLYKDGESGLTLYDNEACIGCHSCAMACPYGAPSFGAGGKMVKCDGCYERIKAGLEPACVHTCPTGALTWRWAEEGEENELTKLYRSWSAVTEA